MLETKEKTIGDCTYRVTQLPAWAAGDVFFRLGKLVAPAIAEVMGDVDKGVTQDKGGAVIAKILDRATSEDFRFLCNAFAPSTSVLLPDGKAPKLSAIFDLHFVGQRFPDMFSWLAFAIEVNYSGFFDKLGGLQALVDRAAAAPGK